MGRSRGIPLRAALLAAVAVFAGGTAALVGATDALEGPELDTVDARFGIRGAGPPPPQLALVTIDDVTFDDLRATRWPFPRSLHARVLDTLRRDGARAIGYDVQFTEETTPAQDNALIEAAARAPSLVLATTEVDDRGRTRVFGGDAVLRSIGARAANTNLVNDGDGVIRRLRAEIDGLDTFPLALAESATGRPVPSSSFDGGSWAWIDFAGPPRTIPSVPFSHVLRGRFAPGTFRGKVVVVGPSAPSLQDVHATSASNSEQMAGAEIQANATATLLRGAPLRDIPAWLAVLIVAVMAVGPPLACVRGSRWRLPLVFVALGGTLALAAQLAFDGGTVLPVVVPALALTLSAGGTLGVDLLTGAMERQRMRDVFARFVPEQVVDQVLDSAGEKLRLGGEERECTVMFCDLRGFTTFSETAPAPQVIEAVNVYLEQMSEAILDAGGTLLVYLGDGIMSVFGAPLAQDDHADRALAAAREMLGERLGRFNAWLSSEGHADGFRMGIGLNTGRVMVGNVGSERRLEYTAIGDVTNTASRLEELTKGTPHALLLAEATKERLRRPPDDLAFVGELEIRGRRQPLRAWTLGAPTPDDGSR
jgi:adenylate cyclase